MINVNDELDLLFLKDVSERPDDFVLSDKWSLGLEDKATGRIWYPGALTSFSLLEPFVSNRSYWKFSRIFKRRCWKVWKVSRDIRKQIKYRADVKRLSDVLSMPRIDEI